MAKKNIFKKSDLNFQFLVWEISAKFEKKYGGLFATHSFTNSRFTDEDGDIHDIRSLGNLLKARGKNNLRNTFFYIKKDHLFKPFFIGHTWISSVVPDFIRLPLSVMHFAGNKF